MKKKILISIFFVAILIAPLSSATKICENIVDMSDPQLLSNIKYESLEVFLEIDGSGCNINVDVSIKNVGSETESVTFCCGPGGGFEVYNKHDIRIRLYPKVTTQMEWEATLQPSETKLLLSESIILPLGTYKIIGFAECASGDLYSEPVTIKIPKSKTRNLPIFNFLENYPIFQFLLKL
jgi:hypothetical protein